MHRSTTLTCHSEERSDVGISCRQLRFRRECPVIRPGTARLHPKGTSSRFALRAPRRFAPRNDTSGWCRGAPAPLRGLMLLHKAVTDRRYSQTWRRVRSAMACTGCKCLPEIAPQGHFLALRAQGATAPLGPRNDNSKPLHVRRCRSTTCDCQRRLLSAATDAIGFHVLSPALYELQVPSRDCHVGLRPPRNDKSEAFAILTVACTDCKCVAGPGCPLPYNASSMPRPCEITCVHPASAG